MSQDLPPLELSSSVTGKIHLLPGVKLPENSAPSEPDPRISAAVKWLEEKVASSDISQLAIIATTKKGEIFQSLVGDFDPNIFSGLLLLHEKLKNFLFANTQQID